MSSPLDGRPERAELLLIPGPVSVEDEVLEALAQPVRAHYGDQWTALYKGVWCEPEAKSFLAGN